LTKFAIVNITLQSNGMLLCINLEIKHLHWFYFIFFFITIPFRFYGQSNTQSNLKDSIVSTSDSIINKLPSTKISKKAKKSETVDAVISYSAEDSIVIIGNGTGILHGSGDVTYKNINLKANYIRVKMDSSMVYAHGTLDSIGKTIGDPIFKEGGSDYNSKNLTYNLKTKKGFIRQAVTKQGEGYIISDKTKKGVEDYMCVADGKYTTCDHTEHPDFYLSLSKAKIRPGKYVVTGPAHLVVADVPLPIFIPFGYFPFTSKYSSGVLLPTYVDDLTRGFGFTNGGYYFAINDYVDLELRSEIYTKGTFALNSSSRYTKRYKFRGNFNVSFREDVTGEINTKDYNKFNNTSIQWSHSQDPKLNPYSTLSSSVNFSTNGYYRNNINSYYNMTQNSQNQKSSSITFSQRFPESPVSFTSSFQVNQQTRDTSISISLPNINFNLSRIFPFKRKESSGKDRWYEKISLQYTANFANSINTKEYKVLNSDFATDWNNGMNHNVPISATYTILKYFNLTGSANFTDRMYFKSIERAWDKKSGREIISNTQNKFSNVWDYNLSISLATRVYGFYIPSRKLFGNNVDRIRHMLTPSISFNYRPDFSDSKFGYYDYYDRYSSTGEYIDRIKYSYYSGMMYGTPSVGESGSIGFTLANNLEMKVKNDKDTTGLEPYTKISLIDNFTITGSYNFVADSLKWSKLNSNIRIKFGNAYTLALGGTFNPYFYGVDKLGNPRMIDKLRWDYGQFPVFEGTSTAFSYTFSNDTFKPKKKKAENPKNKDTNNTDNSNKIPVDPNNQPTNNTTENDSKDKDKDGYTKVKIPWSLSVNYNVRYGMSTFDKIKKEYNMELSHGLSLSGNISLSPNWRFSSSTSYDFKYKQFSYASINITRKLHCWTMTGMAVPFGPYKSYTFKLAVDASMLQDLKYEKKNLPGTNNTTWY